MCFRAAVATAAVVGIVVLIAAVVGVVFLSLSTLQLLTTTTSRQRSPSAGDAVMPVLHYYMPYCY